MIKEDYCKTFEINGVKVDLGMDDYGQCYYVEWEEDGKLKKMGLGTYNMDYMETMYLMFDERYRELFYKEKYERISGASKKWRDDEDKEFVPLTVEERKELEKYKEIFREEYKQFE